MHKSRYKFLTHLILPTLTRSMSTTSKNQINNVLLEQQKHGNRRAAIAQLCSTSNKITNIINIAKCAGMAKRSNANMLLLPECFGYIGESGTDTLDNSEPSLYIDKDDDGSTNDYFCGTMENQKIYTILSSIVMQYWSGYEIEENDDACVTKKELQESYAELSNQKNAKNWGFLLYSLRSIAHISNMWISGGGMHESNAPPDNTRVYNSHVIINSDGKLISVYRKIHLFDVSIPDQNIYLKESNTTAPGDKLIVVPNTPLGNLGLSTCYDMRFPEMYLQLVSSQNSAEIADVILIPSAFTVPTGKAHWHTLCKARAIETQCYVLASAQVGKHNGKRESYGHSIAVDPWGVIVAEDSGVGNGKDDSNEEHIVPSVTICDIDLGLVETVRQKMPLQLHRRSTPFSF